jgi:hypothetical protein
MCVCREGANSADPEIRSLCTVRSPEYGMRLMAPAAVEDFYSDVVKRMMDGAAELGLRVREILPENYRPDVTLEQSILDLDGHNGRDGCICKKHDGVHEVDVNCPVRGLRVHNGKGGCICEVADGIVKHVRPDCQVKGLEVLGYGDLATDEDSDHFKTFEQLLEHAKIFVQVRY